jgi:hypothetical protein
MIALWLGVTVVLATIIALMSEMPFWGALLVSAFAVFINSLVLRVEDNFPGGIDNPNGTVPTNRVVRVCLRVAGVLLGLGSLVMGVSFFGDPPSPASFWSSYIVPFGLIVTGIYFAHYGLTGRSKLMRRI